ncbi:MAG: response regulator [Bacteroidota bacterium]|nr:response regulator [Bacteroidota bacterium]
MNYSIHSILLVDDDQDDKYFFHKALEVTNPEISLSFASDGLDALEKLQFITPDVILLDLNMPKMNGVPFLKKIKSTRHLRDIPVIIYTAGLSVFDEAESLKLGAYQVYLKPQTFDETKKTIADILQISFIRMRA